MDRPIVVDRSPAAEQAVAVALDLATAQTAEVVFVHCSPIAAALLEARGASLVVAGSRRRGPISGAVLGSVSHGLLSVSGAPVLVGHAQPR